MAGTDHKPRGGVSRSRLIVALLVFVSMLVASLVWQAIQTASSNRATATRVLQDYGRLAGDEFIRRAIVEVGYAGYYAHLNALRQRLAAGTDILADPLGGSADDEATKAAQLADFHFVVDPSAPGGRFSEPVTPGVQAYVAGRLPEIAESSSRPSLVIEHGLIDDRSRTFVFASANQAMIGFEVDRDVLSERLHDVYEGEPLLPESLAHGAVGNESLYLAFADDNGEILFASKETFDPYLLTTTVIDDNYSGIFLGHTIAVAVDADAADALIIGGLPRSRLPVLLVTVLLTVALLVAAILQLRREYALMKMRNDFVAEVSHELRTPLTQIRLFVETLLLERFETVDTQRRALQVINRESQRLSHLVDNVLRFSGGNGEQPALDIRQGPLAPTIERVIDEFRLLADGAGDTIELTLDGAAEARFDRDALRQILLNLLDNAVKYGPEGQAILVVLQSTIDGARLSVHDQGPGVPEAERLKIWDGYYRLERDRDSAIAGTGIGLAVVKDLVTRLGGKAWVEHRNGAVFIVEFRSEGAPP